MADDQAIHCESPNTTAPYDKLSSADLNTCPTEREALKHSGAMPPFPISAQGARPSDPGDHKPVKRNLRRIFVTIGGSIVLAAGVAMIFLPGPALIVIPAGFAILATEFEWARRARDRTVKMLVHARDRVKGFFKRS